MKKHLIRSSYVLFALIIILTINSCRKETLNFETKLSAKSLDLISEAKLHFDNSLKESPSDRGLSGNEEKNKFQLLGKKALWEYAKVKKMTVGESVRVPIFYDEENFIKVGKDKKAMSLYNLSYLMMYKDKKGKMQTEWVITIPDDDYVDRKRNSGIKFTGVIHVLDWKGNLIKSYRYQKDGSVLLGTQLTFGKENSLKVSGNQQPIKQFDYWAKDCVTNYYWTCSYLASNPSDVSCGNFYSVTTCYYSYVIEPRGKEDVPSGGGGGGEPTPTPGGGPSDYTPDEPDCPVSGNPENPGDQPPLIGERSISTNSDGCEVIILPLNKLCSSTFQFQTIVVPDPSQDSRGWKEASVANLQINVVSDNYLENIWNTLLTGSGVSKGKFNLEVGVPGDLPNSIIALETGYAINKAMVMLEKSYGTSGIVALISSGLLGLKVAELSQIYLSEFIPGCRVSTTLSGRTFPSQPKTGTNCN